MSIYIRLSRLRLRSEPARLVPSRPRPGINEGEVPTAPHTNTTADDTMNTLTIFGLLLVAYTPLIEARWYKREAVEPNKHEVAAVDKPEEKIKEHDTVFERKEESNLDAKENNSNDAEKHEHSHEHNYEHFHEHKHEHNHEKESKEYEDDFMAILAIFIDPKTHRPRVVAQELPNSDNIKLVL